MNKYCIGGELLPRCATGESLIGECACPSSDNSIASNTGYAAGTECVPGADSSTAGSFVPGPTCADYEKITTRCNCGGAADGTVNSYCIAGSLLSKCSIGVALSAECACPSSDETQATNSGYSNGYQCDIGSGSSPGSFSDANGGGSACIDGEQISTTCDCESASDGTAGMYCLDGYLYSECTIGVSLSQECACPSSDSSLGDNDGYQLNAVCERGVDPNTPGTFSMGGGRRLTHDIETCSSDNDCSASGQNMICVLDIMNVCTQFRGLRKLGILDNQNTDYDCRQYDESYACDTISDVMPVPSVYEPLPDSTSTQFVNS